MKISRRNILRGAAGLTLALPYFESFAQAAVKPRRIIFVFTANGDHTSRRMTVKGETNFVFDDMLSPFEAWRQKVLVLDGVDKRHYMLPSGRRADAHQQGGSALAPWPSGTGSFPIGGGNGATIGYVEGPSLDRALGDRVLAASSSVPYRHLVYRVGDNGNNIWNQHSHAGPVNVQAPIPPETSPFQAYSRIFGNLNTAQQDALRRRLAMRRSSLDLVNAELTSLKPKLSSSDRQRLESHTESVREIERGLTSLQTSIPECKPLVLGNQFDVYNPDMYQQVGFLFFKISAMAFACDLSRVVQFNWSGNTSDRVYGAIGMTEGHHTISHNSDDVSYGKIRAIKKHLFQLSCQLHTELQSIPEAGGGTIWDNTCVVHWSELSQGDSHATDNDLVILAGGAQSYFRMGRYLNVANQQRKGMSDLMVSLFHYMGFTDVSSFGDPALMTGTGPMPNLT